MSYFFFLVLCLNCANLHVPCCNWLRINTIYILRSILSLFTSICPCAHVTESGNGLVENITLTLTLTGVAGPGLNFNVQEVPP